MNVYDHNAAYADVVTAFITESRETLLKAQTRILHCLAQLSDEQLWWRPRPEMNAIGNLLRHVCGNMEQWIIAPIENRPAQRNRPAEFALREPLPKARLQAEFQDVITRAAAALATLSAAGQLLTPRRIQGNNTNILTAIYHSVAHLQGHAQEIIALTRQLRGADYRFLWVPQTPEEISAS